LRPTGSGLAENTTPHGGPRPAAQPGTPPVVLWHEEIMSEPVVPQEVFDRYRRLQDYVGWNADDASRVRNLYALVEPVFDSLVDDFYRAIVREPHAAKVITGGEPQIARLKIKLRQWLEQLFEGHYAEDYVARRWKVGWRHVEIGLEQAFTDAAMCRLRDGLLHALETRWQGSSAELCDYARSLCRLIDLDLAIIQDAYEAEHVRRQREAERLRSETAFRRLVEEAGIMIVILRTDNAIAYFNPFAEKLTGLAAAAVAGKDFFSILLPESDREKTAAILATLHAAPARGYETRMICRDGTERWMVWNAQTLDDFEGARAVLILGQDITQRREAEARALQSERLAAIGETVAGLAHESRNAFQRSQACLELLSLELADRPDELELVSRIQRALDHLHRLYEEVRDYAAPIKLDKQICDLRHLWRDAWTYLEVSRENRSIEMIEQVDDVDLTISADWFALGQVFRNIFENALAACPDPGRIEIQCREVQLADAPAVEIAIRDNGPGIAAEARRLVFDAFFTTKTKGTGLGMAIARRIVDAHCGLIDVGESRAGAEFVITLPRG
jgi:two-component system, LuxR family, sensor kinase FixL